MKLYTTHFTVSSERGDFSHNANVAIQKSKGDYLVKWDFTESFGDINNKAVRIIAESEREAFEKFVKNRLFFASVEIVLFSEVKFN